MAETVSQYALTTTQRVLDRLGIVSSTNVLAVIPRLINSASKFFETECGDRKFVQRQYVNEVYSAEKIKQEYIEFKQSIVLINPAYFTQGPGGGIKPIASAQYRAGTPDAPNWTDFIVSQYEMVDMVTYPDGNVYAESGIIRIYGYVPRIYDNMIRFSYTAGYPVNWANAGDENTHLLPADISNTVENLVVRYWKRRMNGGMGSESIQGSTVSWRDMIDSDDRAVITHYQRAPIIM